MDLYAFNKSVEKKGEGPSDSNLQKTRNIISVDEITTRIKNLLEKELELNDINVRGEISNFHHHVPTGHMYFKLKSKDSQLKCVSFRQMNRTFKFKPQDGLSVICSGNIGVYAGRGEYQLYVKDILPDGIGALHDELERLKRKLRELGLFNNEHKKPLPAYPRKIGVITGAGTAAFQDIIKTLKRRFPLVKIVLCSAIVQGIYAEESIIASLQKLNGLDDLDEIILARGGGSLEDLWAFNLEKVVLEIFNSQKPVITGIGHQTDLTLADLVSDLRAPTPTGAAELAVPDQNELSDRIVKTGKNLKLSILNMRENYLIKLESLKEHMSFRDPVRILYDPRQKLDEIHYRLIRESRSLLVNEKERLNAYSQHRLLSRPRDSLNIPKHRLDSKQFELDLFFNQGFLLKKDLWGYLNQALFRNRPHTELIWADHRLAALSKELIRNVTQIINDSKGIFKENLGILRSLSPRNILDRGYARIQDANGEIIKDAFRTNAGDIIQITFRRSSLTANVKTRRRN